MTDNNNFDIIIIGGSYSGLAAAMALGRAMKKVLVIDSGEPCNKQTPYSHNFLTNDGQPPKEILALAHLQLKRYHTVQIFNGLATSAIQINNAFKVKVASGEIFQSKKLVFATGIKDIFPSIQGFAQCWGISVLHCPYCHGYEVQNVKTAILGNGEPAFDFTRLISNWTKDLTLLTSGVSTLTSDQRLKLLSNSIETVEKEVEKFEHINGHLQNIVFKDGSIETYRAIYSPRPFEQHCKIPENLGCELTNDGYIKTDSFHETTVKGIYAIGDNASRTRTAANAVAMGTAAGIAISKKMVLDEF